MELPPAWFVKASATWGECLNYRGERALLQTKMVAVPSKRTSLENSTEKQGTVNSLVSDPCEKKKKKLIRVLPTIPML